MKTLRAPWTDEQIECLSRYQACDSMHPYTCTCGTKLTPTQKGWICPHCGNWNQQWCHAEHAEPSFLAAVRQVRLPELRYPKIAPPPAAFSYVPVVVPGDAKGTINLFFGDFCVAWINNTHIADQIRAAIPERITTLPPPAVPDLP